MVGNGAEASYGALLTTSLLVLGAVAIAAFVVVRLIGRFLGPGRARGMHLLDVVARVPLEPRRSLYVVEVAGKTLLVGTSEMGLSVLSELDATEVKSRIVPPTSFADLVRGAMQRRKGLANASMAPDAAPHATAGATSHAVPHIATETRTDAPADAAPSLTQPEAPAVAGTTASTSRPDAHA